MLLPHSTLPDHRGCAPGRLAVAEIAAAESHAAPPRWGSAALRFCSESGAPVTTTDSWALQPQSTVRADQGTPSRSRFPGVADPPEREQQAVATTPLEHRARSDSCPVGVTSSAPVAGAVIAIANGGRRSPVGHRRRSHSPPDTAGTSTLTVDIAPRCVAARPLAATASHGRQETSGTEPRSSSRLRTAVAPAAPVAAVRGSDLPGRRGTGAGATRAIGVHGSLALGLGEGARQAHSVPAVGVRSAPPRPGGGRSCSWVPGGGRREYAPRSAATTRSFGCWCSRTIAVATATTSAPDAPTAQA